MRFSYILPFLLAGPAVSALPSLFGSQQPLSDDEELQVPGENPFVFCEAPDDYLLNLTKVDLDPNPPKAGHSLSISAEGKLSKTVRKGAKLHLIVKYGLITLIKTEEDLCDQLDNADMPCPIKKGDVIFSKDENLPKQIPPGDYTVEARVYTKEKEDITCLKASIAFNK
jgi:hypothetical protein